MKKFVLKKELDTTELIKWISAVVGGLVIFLMITLKDYELKVFQLQEAAGNQLLQALDIMKDYKPSIKIHYTNMLTINKEKLLVRVYIQSTSKNDIYIFPPKLALLDDIGNEISKDKYTANGISSFQGTISPESSFEINYIITIKDLNPENISNITLDYEVQIDDLAPAPIKNYFKQFGSVHEKEIFHKLNSKKYKYKERLYEQDENPIWHSFWKNPR